jgi:hypothetical protein
MGRSTKDIATAMHLLQQLGPARGYFPEPEKSIVVCPSASLEAARQDLAAFDFRFSTGHRYLGGFLGDATLRQDWIRPQVEQWEEGVRVLAKIAKRFPQTAYAGLSQSLQSEWLYLQRVAPNCSNDFTAIEHAIKTAFLPALFGDTKAVTGPLRELAALPVRNSGLGLPDPKSTAEDAHYASTGMTSTLSASLLEGVPLDVQTYKADSYTSRLKRRKDRQKRNKEQVAPAILRKFGTSSQRRLKRAAFTGAWLTVLPNPLNGTDLSAEEFRDSLRLRCDLRPLGIPQHCDGCNAPFTVEHALSCAQGGLVVRRHDAVKHEWHHLCSQALTAASVTDEPLIHSGRLSRNEGEQGQVPPQSRGDVAAHGFWDKDTTAIFDVLITDTDASSHLDRTPAKVLLRGEQLKKNKHEAACLERRRHFTPLVFSVDGMRGKEANAAGKRLAQLLSIKWKQDYANVCGFVRSRLSIALVRTMSQCIRGARDPTARATHPTWDSGPGLNLYD